MSTALATPSQRLARGHRAGHPTFDGLARFERFVAGEPLLLEEPKVVRPPREVPPVWPALLALAPAALASLGALAFFASLANAGQARELLLLVAYLCVIPAAPFSLVAAPIPLLVRRGEAPGQVAAAAGPVFVLVGALLAAIGGSMASAEGSTLVLAGAATLVVSPLLPLVGLGALWHHRSAAAR